MSILEIRNLHKSFGALDAVNDIDLRIRRGERHAIIGPNGSGKTTLFNLITGWIKPNRGEIFIDGVRQEALTPQEITKKGFARSFQRNMLLEGLTVFENLRLGVQAGCPSRRSILKSCDAFADVREKAQTTANLMQLDALLGRTVGQLSYGEKRQLEVAIALCSSPKILLLDEPAAGTSPVERIRLVELIRNLPKEITLVLVEHDMDVVFGVAESITVLSRGQIIASGTPEEIRANRQVQEAYLGRRGHA
jgi:branched-chain amino acid transport system ATP-binding protein